MSSSQIEDKAKVKRNRYNSLNYLASPLLVIIYGVVWRHLGRIKIVRQEVFSTLYSSP